MRENRYIDSILIELQLKDIRKGGGMGAGGRGDMAKLARGTLTGHITSHGTTQTHTQTIKQTHRQCTFIYIYWDKIDLMSWDGLKLRI